MIDVFNLSAKQGNITVFSELDLHLRQGEVISLLGPNGCGKTTLLRTMMGLHPNISGMIQIEGANIVDLPPKVLARKISYVPQYHRLAFGYSVLDMVLMGVMAGYSEWARPTNAQKAMAEAALIELNIAHLSQRPYTELSGGQRQLVLIARALAQNTPYVFLDEPTNGLDYGNQLKLLDKIKNLSTEHRCILMTTHHPEHAMMIANRVITMQQGRLTQDGAPASVLTSQTLTELYDLAPEQAQDLWLQKLTPSSFKVVKTA